ncbi:MAG TPA: L,D-transpeptidase family protein [Terriglobales bacterium]|nr:L,D-transpeptidase family protein [Terriglobales bacterium]
MRTFICTVALILLAVCSSADNAAQTVDHVIVLKKERTLQLLSHDKILKAYKVALGGNPVGTKVQQGDHRTPEGIYVLDHRNDHSHYYKSIHISYPNAADRARAAKLHVATGGDIFLHGLPNGYGAVGSAHRLRDWTDGCVAVTDEEIDEIWKLVADGTPIEIKP